MTSIREHIQKHQNLALRAMPPPPAIVTGTPVQLPTTLQSLRWVGQEYTLAQTTEESEFSSVIKGAGCKVHMAPRGLPEDGHPSGFPATSST